jgi:hypothetical protein
MRLATTLLVLLAALGAGEVSAELMDTPPRVAWEGGGSSRNERLWNGSRTLRFH